MNFYEFKNSRKLATPTIIELSGFPGSGKTWCSIELAREMRKYFADVEVAYFDTGCGPFRRLFYSFKKCCYGIRYFFFDLRFSKMLISNVKQANLPSKVQFRFYVNLFALFRWYQRDPSHSDKLRILDQGIVQLLVYIIESMILSGNSRSKMHDLLNLVSCQLSALGLMPLVVIRVGASEQDRFTYLSVREGCLKGKKIFKRNPEALSQAHEIVESFFKDRFHLIFTVNDYKSVNTTLINRVLECVGKEDDQS